MSRLKECAHCGSEAVSGSYGGVFETEYFVKCSSEECRCVLNGYCTLEEAIKAWNTRSTQPDISGAVELLDEVIDSLNDDRRHFNNWMKLTKIKNELKGGECE